MTFGEQLKAARKSLNFTQEELASLAGTTKAAISRYEKGQRFPSGEMFLKLCSVLGIEDDDVLDLAKLANITSPQLSSAADNLLECNWIPASWALSASERAVIRVMRVFNTEDPSIQRIAELSAFYTEEEYKNNGYAFSDAEGRIVKTLLNLNAEGQQKAVERVEELTEIPKYQAQKPPETDE